MAITGNKQLIRQVQTSQPTVEAKLTAAEGRQKIQTAGNRDIQQAIKQQAVQDDSSGNPFIQVEESKLKKQARGQYLNQVINSKRLSNQTVGRSSLPIGNQQQVGKHRKINGLQLKFCQTASNSPDQNLISSSKLGSSLLKQSHSPDQQMHAKTLKNSQRAMSMLEQFRLPVSAGTSTLHLITQNSSKTRASGVTTSLTKKDNNTINKLKIENKQMRRQIQMMQTQILAVAQNQAAMRGESMMLHQQSSGHSRKSVAAPQH